MTVDFLVNKIEKDCTGYDIVVLKGFANSLVVELGLIYNSLDSSIFEDDVINLEKINNNQFLLNVINYNDSAVAICTYESFISMCSKFQSLEILNKKICVLENNLFDLYQNPTNISIPDFDSKQFEDTETPTQLYSLFYSYCTHEGGLEYIQYIDTCFYENQVERIFLADPIQFKTYGIISSLEDCTYISTKDGSLDSLLHEMYETMTSCSRNYAVPIEDIANKKIRAFVVFNEMLGNNIKVYEFVRNIDVTPRMELYDVMKEVWGYEEFRQLKIYKDLMLNHDVTEISQGTIIETVIQQAENAYKKKGSVQNILLTSPTGAGKSLLFQLSAIYLAKKYNLLTIVVSPLVALMNDQVDGLVGYDGVATLNSNKTATEKEITLRGVKEGNINILYLSPELLLSYSISTFIGERKIGLLVIDEAHTVTTWGRDFRVDYWFLGDHLRKIKRELNCKFPIFALTATAVWDPTGNNDMVLETIKSLNMDPCIKFIGVVRRDNIVFDIQQSNISKNYEEKRKQLTIRRIKEALENKKKTIVYFPFARTIESVIKSDEIADVHDKVAHYYARLWPAEKQLNAEAFKLGEMPIMCATKAFGMGVDVSDIEEVYHHAPTGCLSDYVQEIGRLARDPKITGVAKIDFSENDFRYIRKLHGLSAIKPYQLIQVLIKLMALYKINGEKRNMLISASDFAYIFPLAEPESIDQNLKSCLLLISNDLLNKLNFQALIVRPKSLFGTCYVEVPSEFVKQFHRQYLTYVKKIKENLFILNADKIWNDKFSNMSFPQFKQKLAEGKVLEAYNIKLKNKVSLELHESINDVKGKIQEFFDYANKYLNIMSTEHRRVDVEEMQRNLPKEFDALKREQFIETFRMLYSSLSNLGNSEYCRVYTSSKEGGKKKESFQLMHGGYEVVYYQYLKAFTNIINEKNLTIYCDINDEIVKLSEFLNSYGLADYQRTGGDEPVIFIRINNPYYINNLIRGKKYENAILNSIYEKYRFAEKVFTYFFTTPMTTKQRWDFIEAYFLGENEDKLLSFV